MTVDQSTLKRLIWEVLEDYDNWKSRKAHGVPSGAGRPAPQPPGGYFDKPDYMRETSPGIQIVIRKLEGIIDDYGDPPQDRYPVFRTTIKELIEELKKLR